MDLHLSEEQQLLEETFERLLEIESSPERVRAAEQQGFDTALWKSLIEVGAPSMRVSEGAGGAGASLLDASLVAARAGRHLASVPLIESIVATRLLERLGARDALEQAVRGAQVVGFCPALVGSARVALGGGRATSLVVLDGEAVRRVEVDATETLPNVAGLSLVRVPEVGGEVLASGPEARAGFEAAHEEWKLLTASALYGLARRALEIAAAYASERVQFDRPIGSFQAIAHPLADCLGEVEAGEVLLRETLWSIDRGQEDAAALVTMVFGWAARVASETVGRALHTHGGYGLSLEYDIQLYFRRAKALAQLAGDPEDAFCATTRRLLGDERVTLPDVGDMPIDFSLGADAEAAGNETRDFFERHLTDELRAHAHPSFEGHHPGLHKALADEGLLYPSWPEEFGGQNRDPYSMCAISEEFNRVGWTTFMVSTTRMVAETLMAKASDELKRDVLPRVASGDVCISLGYTEPQSGSDVAGAQTRAERRGDGWVINGHKLFTSGANLADYVFLLTRTNPDVAKHKGLTMFLVPLDAPGVTIQPIHTLSDERTNATYYTDVEVPDRYRVGEVDGGWNVLGYALEIEHGGAGAGFAHDHWRMVEAALRWGRETDASGRRRLDDPRIAARIGLAAARARVGRALGRRNLWAGVEGCGNPAQGPMEKVLCTEGMVRDATDLLDLTAPDSLLNAGAGSLTDGVIEFGYRLGAATTIYGGSSEIMRSIVAQVGLGMPRSRS